MNTQKKNESTLWISALLWMSIFIIDAVTAGITIFG